LKPSVDRSLMADENGWHGGIRVVESGRSVGCVQGAFLDSGCSLS
jgi:hypothetical protein